MKATFIDEADIAVESGSGGDGSIHFRRARFIPKGGPDGGDGGVGGDVIIFAGENLSDLSYYLHKSSFKAQGGAKGGPNRQHGKNGGVLRLAVPVGTQVYEWETKELLCDLDTPNTEFIVARGGRGGKGNFHFRNSVRQAPRIAQKGLPGKRVRLHLIYKMKTDVGLIGPPNTGKSSLLSQITSAKPRIAEYPFTTRVPQFGVYIQDYSNSLTLVEIPAIGAGRDNRYLRHVERAQLLLILLKLSRQGGEIELLNEINAVMSELDAHVKALSTKPKILVLNKVDTIMGEKYIRSISHMLEGETGIKTLVISVKTGEGLEKLLKVISGSCTLSKV